MWPNDIHTSVNDIHSAHNTRMRGSMATNISGALEFSMKKAGITELKDKQRSAL